MLAGFSLLALANPAGKLPPVVLLPNPTSSPEGKRGTRSQLAEGRHHRFRVAVGVPALLSLATSSSFTLKLVRQRWQRRPRSRTREPFLFLYASRVCEQSATPGRLSNFLARFRSGNRQQLERELVEARSWILQAEQRAELLQSQLGAKLQEEEQLNREFDKQIASLKEAYGELSDRLEQQETEAAQELEKAALQLSASKFEEEAMLKRLQHAEKTEKQLETEQKKLLEQLNLARGKELSLQVALKQRESELAKAGAQRVQLRASEADAQQQLRDVKSQLQQLTVRFDDLKDRESREEALSDQLAQAHAGNKLLDEKLQEAERKLEKLLKERRPLSSKGAGKGRGKSKGKGKGTSR